MFESGIKIVLFLCLISSFQALLRGFGLLGSGFSIHGTHVVNNFRPLHPEVPDEETPLQFFLVLCREPFEIFVPYSHGATCIHFGVVTHMCEGKGLARKV